MSEKLQPQKNGKPVTVDMWHWHTSNNHRWELYDGLPFSSNSFQRDKLALCLLYSMGLEHLLALLPDKSKEELRFLLNSGKEFNLPYDYNQTFKEYQKLWQKE